MSVAVAVSGGLDSVALLDLLVATQRWHGGALSVVTVDHGVRPGSSEDADFVAALAEAARLPFSRFDLRLRKRASEEAMRRARHEALSRAGADRVATAHHRDDQVETVLLRLIRGSSSTGLAGIRPRSGAVVHPLLGVWRSELAAWASHRELTWREDPTNAELTADRNRVRAEVIPLLEQIRPGCRAAIARTADRVGEDDAWLGALASAADPGDRWTRDFVERSPDALIRRLLKSRAPSSDSPQIDRLLAAIRAGKPLAEGDLAVSVGADGASSLSARSRGST
jgi:tRNA(Ile)-lysidine synthase